MLPALLAVLGGGLATAALNVAGLRVGATPAELVLWGATGVLFARVFSIGALVIALPVLLAGIELATGVSGASPAAEAGDPLTLALPGQRSVELTLVVFAAVYGTWAQRFDLRWQLVWALLAGVLAGAVAVEHPLATATLLGSALLLPNLDRLAGLLRAG